MNILFRCDGSEKIGFGHLSRCLSLALEIKSISSANILFCIKKNELAHNYLKRYFDVIIFNDSDNYSKWFKNLIRKKNIDKLILDVRNDISSFLLKSIKKEVSVITIDDPEDKRIHSDISFYPPVPQVNLMNWKNYKGKLYVGWEYVILNKKCLQIKNTNKNKIKNQIVISMGFSDPFNITNQVINYLKSVEINFKIIVIIGDGYKHINQLELSVKNFNNKIIIKKNPKNIYEIISSSLFGIISFGQTAYEFASLNVPAIYLSISKDHYQSSKAFKDIGISIGLFNKLTPEKFILNYKYMIENHNSIRDKIIKKKLKKKFLSKSISYKILS